MLAVAVLTVPAPTAPEVLLPALAMGHLVNDSIGVTLEQVVTAVISLEAQQGRSVRQPKLDSAVAGHLVNHSGLGSVYWTGLNDCHADVAHVALSLEKLRNESPPVPTTFFSVAGSMNGLTHLPAVRPDNIVFFDMNPAALETGRLVVELVKRSESAADYMTRVFLRNVSVFERSHGPLTHHNQHEFMQLPLSPDVYEETRTSLPAELRDLYSLVSSFADGERHELTDHVPVRQLVDRWWYSEDSAQQEDASVRLHLWATQCLLPCMNPAGNDLALSSGSGFPQLFESTTVESLVHPNPEGIPCAAAGMHYGLLWLEQSRYREVRSILLHAPIQWHETVLDPSSSAALARSVCRGIPHTPEGYTPRLVVYTMDMVGMNIIDADELRGNEAAEIANILHDSCATEELVWAQTLSAKEELVRTQRVQGGEPLADRGALNPWISWSAWDSKANLEAEFRDYPMLVQPTRLAISLEPGYWNQLNRVAGVARKVMRVLGPLRGRLKDAPTTLPAAMRRYFLSDEVARTSWWLW